MAEPISEKQWPDYMPLPRDDIFAIGVIALNYCQLENMLRALFSNVTQLNEFQTQAFFHRLANNVRKDVLLELLGKTTIPDDLRASINHFMDGFAICAENRHFVMHSSSGGLHSSETERGLVLERYSRSGNKLACYLTLNDLKLVADEIHGYMIFGAHVVSDTARYAAKPEKDFAPSPSTLREKPPPPTRLSWSAPVDPTTPALPPAASLLLSPYRVRGPKPPP
jgi:hypothetical protein